MKSLILLAAILAIAEVEPAKATTGTTGEELQNNCKLATSVQPNQALEKDQWLSAGQCLGQIEGILDTLLIWHAMNGIEERAPNGEPCLPNGVTVRQITLVVLKYLDNHPEKLHLLASNLIRLALLDAYPCKA